MYDIQEGGAGTISWSFPVKGMDTTDAVMGGINGNTNQPLITLTLRSRNLHERLLIIEALLNNDADNVINNLKDILDAFSGETEQVALISLLAKKSCNVTTTADKASWVTALEIAKRTYNLNVTEKGTWVTGLGVDNKAGKIYDLTPAERNSWQGGGFFDGFAQDLDNNQFAQLVQAFTNIYANPSATSTLIMAGGSNSFNLNVANWKAKLGINIGTIARRGSVYIGNVAGTWVTYTISNFSAIGSNNYHVYLSLVSNGSSTADADAMCFGVIRGKSSGSFQVLLRDISWLTANGQMTQDLWLEYMIVVPG